jgi:hypothetical protein
MQLRVVGAILLAAAGSGCSTNSELLGQMYVSPGKYEYYRCPEIAIAIAGDTKQEQDLMGLVDRANQGSAGTVSAGTVIGAVVYNPQLATTREELRQLHEAWAQKNCVSQPPPPAAPAAPADTPKPRKHPMMR